VPCNWLRVSQNSTRISYRHHPDMSSEQARDARALALRFALDCYAKKNAPGVSSTNGDGATKGFQISEKEKGGRHVVH
jgi:hypothetical protein